MDTVPLTDLNRMILAIDQEAQARIKELRVETVQLYNKLKADYIEAGMRAVDGGLRQRARAAAERRARAEAALRSAFRKRVEAARSQKVQDVMESAATRLRACPLAPLLLEQCIARMGASDYYVFCAERDMGAVNSLLADKFEKEVPEVREIPDAALGGVILFSKTGKEVWDNSFQTRLCVFREKHIREAVKALFPAMR